MNNGLLELACQTCGEAQAHGAQMADVSIRSTRSVTIVVEKNSLHTCQDTTGFSVSVRSIVRGATAHARTTIPEASSALTTARRSAEAAPLMQPDPDFVSLPPAAAAEPVPRLFDQRIADLRAEDLIELMFSEVDAARAVHPGAVVQGSMTLRTEETALASSLGMGHQGQETMLALSLFCVVRDGDDVGSYYDFDFARSWDDFNPAGLGARTCVEAARFLGARTVDSRSLPVVLGPMAVHGLLWGVGMAASAHEIQRHRSFLADKRGQQIASPLFSLRDDGLISGGMGSGARDWEGAPRRRVTLIENGTFANVLHGSYSANKAGEENTGHGTRGPDVFPSNLITGTGSVPAAEIIADTSEGIYVDHGGLFPNSVTGEISATVDFGYKIEHGRLAYPLKNTMLGINIIDLLRSIDAISSDYRSEPGVILPTIRVKAMKIAGGA